MSYYGGRKCSLIEQKRQQWAKEKEELANLSMPWGRTYTKYDRNTSVRAKNLSKYSNSEVSLHREEGYANRNLPPITRKVYDPDQYEVEGDTSGYASDSAKEGGPEYYVNRGHKKQDNCQVWTNWHHRSSESDISVGRDERPKWGDRGLGVGHLWDPHDEQHDKAVEPPGWLQRGLNSDKEVVVVSQSPEQTTESSGTDRPYTGESSNTNMNVSMRSHLRGQNIPLEPGEAAERERKRQKALELQNAIKQQLEEREIKRKLERERQLREEAEEESRIRREQEIERQRVEEEQKIINEKKEREKKRNQAMQEALESAEKAAKLEKSKLKNMRMKSNVLNLPEEEPAVKKETKTLQEKNSLALVPSPRINSPIALPDSPLNHNHPNQSVVPQLQQNDSNILTIPPEQKHYESNPETHNYNDQKIDNQIKLPDNSNADNITLVLQNPFDNFQTMQLALLVPTASVNMQSALPVAVPMPVVNERSVITENRILTPSIYRMRHRSCRETSTQTESSYFSRPDSGSKSDNKKEDNFGSLDRRANSNSSAQKDRRMRSEERNKESNTEKPKWGVNRPPMRYLKQSEKDPVYQKRKLRQKTRETIFEDKNNNYTQSSDDSMPQTPDHRIYRKQRNLWHKNERMFSQNISVYQTEIVPLELDRQGRLYVKDRAEYKEMHSAKVNNNNSRQKQRDSPPEMSRRSGRERKKLQEKEDSFETTENEGIMDQLTNLRHGLMLKQKEWDDEGPSTSTIELPSLNDNP